MTGAKEGDKPKVLIFLNRLVIGGPAIDVISMAGFLQNDFEVLVVYGEKESHEVEATFLLNQYPNLPTKKMRLLTKAINPIKLIKSIYTLFSILIEFKPDIVHTHGALPGVLGRISAKIYNTKVIVHTFHGHFFHSYFNRFFSSGIILIERMLSKISDSIIATSYRQMNDLTIKYQVAKKEKVTIIDLGIDEKFLATKTEKKEDSFSIKYKIPEGAIAIGIIARIVRVKNFFLFVDIVEKVLKRASKKVVFYVIGDGYQKQEVQESLTSKGIKWCNEKTQDNASVIFTSWIPDVGEALSLLDIVILTSNNEGTGLSLAEGQYCGNPVVATNVGGVADTLVDGETGFLIEPKNATLFAEKLLLLIEDEELRNKMGKAAEVFAKNRFSKKNEIKKLKKLYFDLLEVKK